jgi:hypothetical protein
MKKFTENTDNERTGSWENGKWVDETPQAKLRNQLGPFWTLSEIISDHPEILQTEDGLKIATELAKQCENAKETIKNLIKETEKNG